MNNSVSESAPKPRLCHVKKWADFNGYGFNLHAEKGKAGQYIGKVDPDSPAEAAGLKKGDRIIEANGTNIGNENHSQVVQRIKAVPNETKLLVVDNETDTYFKEQKIVIRGDMPYVQCIECPDEQGGAVKTSSPAADNSTADVDDSGPPPRQCHLCIWSDFQGYGFNLHAEKGKPGQFIGKVDEGSPAEDAGLKPGDRIVEVNGEYIGDDNHPQVVSKIKSITDRTRMLVVDEDTEDHYRAKGVRVHSGMSNVVNIHCANTKAEATGSAPSVEPSPAPEQPSPTPEEPSPAPVEVTSAPVELNSTPSDGPIARLCHVRIWSDYQGYGFNLHADKGKGGQFIGKVDEGSPAEAAGLKQGDKIIEVNGNSVLAADHRTVVQNIKSEPNEARLLVLDGAGFEYYKERNEIESISSSSSNVQTIVCPICKPIANGGTDHIEAEVNHTQVNGAASSEEPEVSERTAGEEAAAAIEASILEAEQEVKQQQELDDLQHYENFTPPPKADTPPPPQVDDEPENDTPPPQQFDDEPRVDTPPPQQVYDEPRVDTPPPPQVDDEPRVETPPPPQVYEEVEEAPKVEEVKQEEAVVQEPEVKSEPAKAPVVVGGIEFAGSAKEARERLTKRSSRKHEVKKQDVSMRDKFELFQKL